MSIERIAGQGVTQYFLCIHSLTFRAPHQYQHGLFTRGSARHPGYADIEDFRTAQHVLFQQQRVCRFSEAGRNNIDNTIQMNKFTIVLAWPDVTSQPITIERSERSQMWLSVIAWRNRG